METPGMEILGWDAIFPTTLRFSVPDVYQTVEKWVEYSSKKVEFNVKPLLLR